MVGEHIGVTPVQAEPAEVEFFGNGPVTQDVVAGQRSRWRRLLGAGLVFEPGPQFGIAALAARDRMDGIDRVAVPVAIKRTLQRPEHEADREGIDVDEVLRGTAQEIFVRHIAPADHRHRAVGDEEFVVHAVVDAAPFPHRTEKTFDLAAFTQAAKRIEEAHLDVLVRRQGQKEVVLTTGVEIVDQQPHPNAALGGVAQCAQQPAAGFVHLEVVVLNVERHLGAARQLHPCIQRKRAQRHEPETRMVFDRPVAAGDAPERGVLGQRNRLAGDGLAVDHRQAAAAHQQQDNEPADPTAASACLNSAGHCAAMPVQPCAKARSGRHGAAGSMIRHLHSPHSRWTTAASGVVTWSSPRARRNPCASSPASGCRNRHAPGR